MLSLFLRTYLLVFLMEFGSASQFMLATSSSHSTQKLTIWVAGVLALMTTSFVAVLAGDFLAKLPIPQNLLVGIILVSVGIATLVHKQ